MMWALISFVLWSDGSIHRYVDMYQTQEDCEEAGRIAVKSLDGPLWFNCEEQQ